MSVFNLTTKFLISFFSPESLAFNDDDNKRYSIKEFTESEALKPDILPGDFVLIQTPGTVYKSIRKALDSCYDHMAVLLDKDTVLHISPPAIRKISSNVFLMKKRNPLIIRANLTENQREEYVKKLESCVGLNYDYRALFRLLGKKIYQKTRNLNRDPLQILEKNLMNQRIDMKKDHINICTDFFLMKLMQISPEFEEIIQKNMNNLNYSYLGSFSPDDLLILSEKNPMSLKAIQCYPTEKMKIMNPLQNFDVSKDSPDLYFEETMGKSGLNLKKLINLIEKVLLFSTLKQNIKEYKQDFYKFSKKTIKNRREVFQSFKLVYMLYQMRRMLKGTENKPLNYAMTRDLLKQGIEIFILLQDSDLTDLLKRSFSRSKL